MTPSPIDAKMPTFGSCVAKQKEALLSRGFKSLIEPSESFELRQRLPEGSNFLIREIRFAAELLQPIQLPRLLSQLILSRLAKPESFYPAAPIGS